MDALRKTALVAGVFYLLTFVSIPTLALYSHVHDADYIIGGGSETALIVGGILEIIVALAGIGTAVALYPVLKRQNEGLALGLVASRTLEAASIFVGVASLLSVAALRQDGVGPDALVTGQALVAFYDAMFRISQGFIPAINGVLLGTLLYQSRLVPRALPMLGFVGAALLVVSAAATLFGVWDQVSAMAALTALPIATWEFGLGLRLTFKGFITVAPAAANAPLATPELAPAT
jgi:hypothetical protein